MTKEYAASLKESAKFEDLSEQEKDQFFSAFDEK
jgi:hypothetical protein